MRRSRFVGTALIALSAGIGLGAQVIQVRPNVDISGSSQSQPLRSSPAAVAPRLIPVGTASISGVVMSSESGRPVRSARVSLNGTAGPPRGDGKAGAIPPPAVWPPLANDNIPLARTTLTNAQGQFVFDRLAAGRYSVSVARDTYLAGGWGQKRAGGPAGSILLADGQRLTLSIPLVRGGVITGQVFDEDGEPVRSTQVQAWRSVMSNGVRRFQQANAAATDDRGMYRLFGLEPGDYRVAAIPRNSDAALAERALADASVIEAAIASGQVRTGAAPGYPSYVTVPASAPVNGPIPVPNFIAVYAPGTVFAAEATMIHVEPNSEEGPFSIHLQYVRAANIHGTLSPPLPPGTQIRVSLSALDSGFGQTALGVQSSNGEFTIRNVAPGRYQLLAQTMPAMRAQPISTNGDPPAVRAAATGAPPPQWAAEEVVVTGETDLDLALGLHPARTISGVVIFETTRPAGAQSGLQAQLTPAPGATNSINGPSSVPLDPDGRFVFSGVVPGRYVIRTAGSLRSALANGEDMLDIPLELTGDRDITDVVITVMDPAKRPTLWGVVTDASGKPVGDVTIVAASTDERHWVAAGRRVLTQRTDPYGRYSSQNLPPGTYYVATVGELETGGQYDPETLRSVAATGARVTLSEGVATRQDFRTR